MHVTINELITTIYKTPYLLLVTLKVSFKTHFDSREWTKESTT